MAVAESKLPATGLFPDTRVAAPGATGDGRGYVGVWAKDATGCLQIDQTVAADFAIITGSTFRNGPSACYGNFGPIVGGKGSITVSCAGATQTVTLEQSSPDAISVNGAALVRCKP